MTTLSNEALEAAAVAAENWDMNFKCSTSVVATNKDVFINGNHCDTVQAWGQIPTERLDKG